MVTTQQANPARTYATPSRAINSVEKMHVEAGGKPVKFVISKDSKGRYFPVFVDRIDDTVSQDEINANPSANRGGRGRAAGRAAVARGDRDVQARPARKTAQKRTARKTAVAKKATRGAGAVDSMGRRIGNRAAGKRAARAVKKTTARNTAVAKKATKKATKRVLH